MIVVITYPLRLTLGLQVGRATLAPSGFLRLLLKHLFVRQLRMGERDREFGMGMDTQLCFTCRTSKDLLYSTGKSAQYSAIT